VNTIAAAAGGHATGDSGDGFENITGSDFDDFLFANDVVNVLSGGGGDDQLYGLGGGDTLLGGAGNDFLEGGAGADILNGGSQTLLAVTGGDFIGYASSPAAVTVTLGNNGAETIGQGGHAQGDRISNVESIIGSEFNDVLTGNSLVNELRGASGNDTLRGRGGDDHLEGEAGSDTLNGGTGDDVLIGDGGADVLNGGSGNDELFGLDGADTINGGNGNDHLVGNDGNDTLNGGDGADNMTGFAGNDTLFGGSGNDNLGGDDGDDILNGGGGNDDLVGDRGNDVMTGGGGNDTFHFTESPLTVGFSLGHDTIVDFDAGFGPGDVIRFDDMIFASFADVLLGSAQVGSDVVITYDDENSITLENVQLASLQPDDFDFV